MNTPKKDIRVVALREGEWWVAVCLDYFIAAQARDESKLEDAFTQAFVAHVVHALQKHETPFGNLGPAPKRYHELYEHGTPIGERTLQNEKIKVDLPEKYSLRKAA